MAYLFIAERKQYAMQEGSLAIKWGTISTIIKRRSKTVTGRVAEDVKYLFTQRHTVVLPAPAIAHKIALLCPQVWLQNVPLPVPVVFLRLLLPRRWCKQ